MRREVDACAAASTDWGPAFEGEEIQAGGRVRTGDEASARLDLCDGAIMRLAANSTFEMLELSPAGDDLRSRLSLLAGRLWLGVLPFLGLNSIEVETPTGAATVRGSYMSVGYEPATGRMLVTCLEGHCRLTASSGRFTDLVAGQQADIAGTGLIPSPARSMDPAQFAEWARVFPEAPVLTPTPAPRRTGSPAVPAARTATASGPADPYVLDTTSCLRQPETRAVPGGQRTFSMSAMAPILTPISHSP